MKVEVGDRVRVSESVIIYHHPEHKKEPFDLKGEEGTVRGFASEYQDKVISATLPIQVRFETASGKKLLVHLREDEVELVSKGE